MCATQGRWQETLDRPPADACVRLYSGVGTIELKRVKDSSDLFADGCHLVVKGGVQSIGACGGEGGGGLKCKLLSCCLTKQSDTGTRLSIPLLPSPPPPPPGRTGGSISH